MDAAHSREGEAWDDLLSVDGVGEVMATSLVTAFAQGAERASIDRLVAHLTIEDAAAPAQSDSPSGGQNRGLHRNARKNDPI